MIRVELELALEGAHHLAREPHFVGLHRGGHVGQFLDPVHAADLVRVTKRVHHQASLARLDLHEIFTAVQRHLADARLAFHSFADDGERVAGHRPVGRQIVRPLEIDRIDVRIVGEFLEIDDARRFHTHLVDVLFADDDVASLLEFVALDDIGIRHFLLAVRAPPLLLDARLTIGVKLVETERRGGVGRRKHLHRNVHEADFQIPFPRRSCGHGSSNLRRRFMS